jgi:hypothetical protein
MTVSTSRRADYWAAALDPARERAALHDETALRTPRNAIRVAQALPELPVDGQRDHIVGETML